MATMPVEMSRLRFEELVAEALDAVPDALLKLMDNVVVLVEDDPEDDRELLGLYEGYALTNLGWG
jgi:predicted Zn-dependent protease with MMP-like domain